MSAKHWIVRQFAKPKGLPGILAGGIMARRSSNRLRNLGTVELMRLTADMHVLEFGCGPGLALLECARAVTSGKVVGVDHSDVMIRQSHARIAAAGLSDRVAFVEGGLEELSGWNAAFDRVFSLNVIQFLPDYDLYFRAVHGLLVPGGLSFTTYQPRLEKDAGAAVEKQSDAIVAAMTRQGFDAVDIHPIAAGETDAICVSGRKGG